jgi:hypothetical protein
MSFVSPPRPSVPFRRSDYDVTNTVQVSSTEAVMDAVRLLFETQWPNQPVEPLRTAFKTFGHLVDGRLPGYNGIDTVYHDRQHTLDATLAMARLLVAYDRTCGTSERLGFERSVMGLIAAIFHDAGYVRKISDVRLNGAEYTNCHVSRSAQFLGAFLPTVGMAAWAPIARQIVHFTGYEVAPEAIELTDPLDRKAGHLLGTADLIAQMSDRCYLEKCRDRLYPEFVLAGVATGRTAGGDVEVRFGSGLDLLRQTPAFVASAIRDRLDGAFGGAYHYVEALYDGQNPYMQAIQQHLTFLQKVLKTENWPLLRRNPPLFTHDPDSLPSVRQLMLGHLRELWGRG